MTDLTTIRDQLLRAALLDQYARAFRQAGNGADAALYDATASDIRARVARQTGAA